MKKTIILLLFFASHAFAKANNEDIIFKTKSMTLGAQKLKVEIADTSKKLERGLMFRKNLAEGNGMLFVFNDEEIRAFWMKNTFIPLSIGYFNSKKELIDIQDMEPVHSEMETNPPPYPSRAPAMFALEVPKGWFQKHKIKLKAKFKLD